LNNKSEIEERLEVEIGQLKDIISQVKFSNSIMHSQEINTEVQGLCAAIIDFLVHALNYQKKPGISKSVKQPFDGFKNNLDFITSKGIGWYHYGFHKEIPSICN
jgi:hypothetical protein